MCLQTGESLPRWQVGSLPPSPLVTHVPLLAQADLATAGALLGFGAACGTANGVQGCSAASASQSGTSPAMLMRLQNVTGPQGS